MLRASMNAFRTAGPYSLKGYGDSTNPTYAQLMATTDLAGMNQSYLASEENFRIVQKLQKDNLVIPLVGDFAGGKSARQYRKISQRAQYDRRHVLRFECRALSV